MPGQCPTVDLDEIAAKAPKKLEASVAADGDETVAFQELGGKRLLTCIGTAGDNSACVLAGPFDASFEESLPKALPGFKIDFSKPESLKGGTLQTYCALGASDNARSCAAQWFDKDLRVGVVSTKSDSTAEDAAQWLKDSLDDIVTSIAKAAPTSGSCGAPDGRGARPAAPDRQALWATPHTPGVACQRGRSSGAGVVLPAVRAWFLLVPQPTPAQAQGWPAIVSGAVPGVRPHGQRQDADGVPRQHRPSRHQ